MTSSDSGDSGDIQRRQGSLVYAADYQLSSQPLRVSNYLESALPSTYLMHAVQ